MCDYDKGNFFEPESSAPCDPVLVKLDKIQVRDGNTESDPTKDQWAEAISAIHGDPRDEGDRYDGDPRV